MKKAIVGLFSLVFGVLVSTPSAHSKNLFVDLFLPLSLNVIDWRVGDYAHYDLDLGFLGKGTLKKLVESDTKEALWVTIDIKTPMGEQNVKALIRKSDGKTLKLIVDGKEQEVQEPNIEIIEQRPEKITVPAGTFRAIYLKVKDKTQNVLIEAWINPLEITVGGVAKSIVKKDFLTMTTELTKFGKKEILESSYNVDHFLMDEPI